MSPLRSDRGTGFHENKADLAVTSRTPKEVGLAVGAGRMQKIKNAVIIIIK